MKKNFVKKIVACAMTATLAVSMFAGCGSTTTDDSAATTSNDTQAEASDATADEAAADTAVQGSGKILWLSNLSSGAQYEAQYAYAKELCSEMGYDFDVCYGDGYNDPDGNLTALKNAMTDDVVGVLASQDGGITSMMEEYPDIWFAGFNCDFNSVYGDDASNASVAENPMWLGTIADGHIDGADTAQQMFDYIQAQGWTKIGVINFPAYAYPNLGVAAETLTALCDEAGIEIPGGYVTLEFSPLDESYFQEEGRDDLDAVVAICAGTTFVYPTLVQAKSDGFCSADTKLVTSGFDNDASLIADIGEDGNICYLTISPNEDIAYSLYLLNLAITGNMYSDFVAERIDAAEYIIDSKEDIDAVMSKSTMADGYDPSLACIQLSDLQATTSFAELQDLFHSEQVSVDYLLQ